MTLEEFQRRLIAQKNAQSQSLLNPNLKLDNYTNDTKKIIMITILKIKL